MESAVAVATGQPEAEAAAAHAPGAGPDFTLEALTRPRAKPEAADAEDRRRPTDFTSKSMGVGSV